MTGVPRHIAEHRLNIREGCPLVKQKRRSQAADRNQAIQEEVEKLVDAVVPSHVIGTDASSVSPVDHISNSDLNRTSMRIIPLMNASELLEMDPYEEVAQQGQAPLLSPAYVPDPIELDEHVPVYVPEPEHPEYHIPSDDDMQHEPEDDNEDPKEDPNEEHEPEDEDTKEEEPSKVFDETESFEEDETAVTPPPPRNREVRISVRPQTPMAASTQALINAFDAGSPPFLLPTSALL
ncbi:hypothetical protein Tco_0906417 [Tanacetum coccineum]|uniref:Uncharacterized protein n=1 Tax=Tanacetum coccineum TaxID=301880 RepID=A0ABQ5CIG7_9ASTR